MNTSWGRIYCLLSAMSLWPLCSAVLLTAQTTTMPSTQRYGSGLINIPVASVLPHMMITGTYSGFFMDLSRTIEVDGSGNEAGFGAPIKDFFSDASFAFGLFDRVEIGTTLQSFNEPGFRWKYVGSLWPCAVTKTTGSGIGISVWGQVCDHAEF